jgi:hypothetical protein
MIPLLVWAISKMLFLWVLVLIGTTTAKTKGLTINTTNTDEDEYVLSQDFIRCIEKGACGIESLCSFHFRKYHASRSNNPSAIEEAKGLCEDEGDDDLPTSESKSTTKVHTTPKPVVNDLCSSIAEGYIFSVANGMDYPVKYHWDILDNSMFSSLALSSTTRTEGTIIVTPKSIRYFTDSIKKTHKVRLFVKNEFIHEALALEARKCSIDDTCDLLFRLCYQAKSDKLEGLVNDTTNHETHMCRVYSNECEGFSKRKNDAAKELSAFLHQYVPSYFMNERIGAKDSLSETDSKLILEMLNDIPTYQKCKDIHGNFIASDWADDDDDSLSASAIVAIVFMSLLILVLIVLVICWVPYCTPSYWVAKMSSDKKVDEDSTMQGNIGTSKSVPLQKPVSRPLAPNGSGVNIRSYQGNNTNKLPNIFG